MERRALAQQETIIDTARTLFRYGAYASRMILPTSDGNSLGLRPAMDAFRRSRAQVGTRAFPVLSLRPFDRLPVYVTDFNVALPSLPTRGCACRTDEGRHHQSDRKCHEHVGHPRGIRRIKFRCRADLANRADQRE